MNERQKKFAEYYAQCGNAAQSAIKAGYSESYATHRTDELLRNVEISEYIRQLSEAEQDKRIMTAKERQALLSDIAQDGDNAPSDRIKAVDTLNKMTGEYTVRVDTTVKTSDKLADVFKQIGGEGLE
ncbi:MAG: terminase small subunit [Oscillospiraceae bacterium]